jgi:hypothetical protein
LGEEITRPDDSSDQFKQCDLCLHRMDLESTPLTEKRNKRERDEEEEEEEG